MARLNKINENLKLLYIEKINQAKLFLVFNEINIQSEEITKILTEWIEEKEKKLNQLTKK